VPVEPWNPIAGVLQSGQLTLDKVGCCLRFQSRLMVLKGVFAAVCCAAILAAGSSRADEYRPDEFLTLDLSKAALSPKPLGPPAQFEPMPGRPMKEYAVVPPSIVAKPKELGAWIERAHRYGVTLPPKAAKKTTATKKTVATKPAPKKTATRKR